MKPRCLKCGCEDVHAVNLWDLDCNACGFGWLKEDENWPKNGWPMGYETKDEWGYSGWTNVPKGCLAVWGEI